MRVQLKNIKHYKAMSEETNAFSADVYFDGKKVGTADNSGKGEGIYPRVTNQAILNEMEQWAKSLPPVKGEDYTLEMDLELYLGQLVSDDLLLKDAQRYFKSRVCLTNEKGALLTTKTMPAERVADVIAGRIPMKLQAGQRILTSVDEVFNVLKGYM